MELTQPSLTLRHSGKLSASGAHLRRLVFITDASAYGGCEKDVIELMRSFDRSRVHPVILCLGVDPYTDRLNQGCDGSVEVTSRVKPGSVWGWLRVLREMKPDVAVFVHCDLWAFTWDAYLAAKVVSRRVYSIQHLIPPPLPPKVEGNSLGSAVRRLAGWRTRTLLGLRLAGHLSDRTVCVSNTIRERLIDDYHYARDKTRTIYNGVRVHDFRPPERHLNSMRKDLGISSDDTVLVCVARLGHVKRIDNLLKAMVKVKRAHESCKCIIVGDGPLRDHLAAQVVEWDLTAHVFFAGFKEDVRPYLQAADIFVLTSHAEGLPLALLEAMACGLPSVVTDVGGNAEAVSHNVNGLVVPPGSVDDIANAICYLVTHKAERLAMSVRARARAEQLFVMDESIERVKSVLLE
jgi:glycosyltransferase involved in cell wall biosynthesis